MKNNLPITNNEVLFAEGEEIISTTDLKGSITSVNDTFLKISGFSSEELITYNHNVIRHPDMPVAVFADLWQHMKANKHWMGIIKNRCKNGDYYWVDAYVTPMIENGQVIGYESVRVKPTAERIARAEKIYQQLNAEKSPKIDHYINRLTVPNRAILINFIAFFVAITTYVFTPPLFTLLPFFTSLIISTTFFIVASKWAFSPLMQSLNKVHQDINNPLMALIYTGRGGAVGQIQLPAELLKAKLRTILGRLKNVSELIEKDARGSADSISSINLSIQQQATETESVANAMAQMTSTVQEIARNATDAAKKAKDADQFSQEGMQHASGAVEGLQVLSNAVQNISNVVSQLDSDTQNIGTVLDVIKGIAEQTNLLALNAAIEAARAGDQGRGFAVVADEVRTLAGRTQDSTQEIQQLIENLNTAVTQAVAVMADSKDSTSHSENQVSKAIDSLSLISEQVSTMSEINIQIAAAVDQQGTVSEGINRTIVQISHNAENVLSGTHSVGNAAETLSNQSRFLTDMIQGFKH